MTFSKKNIREVLDSPKSPLFGVVNDVLAFATLISILAVVLETVPSLEAYKSTFLYLEWTVTLLFSLEYAARLWSAKKPGQYAFSVYGVIDLVAILPTIFGVGNLSFLKSARIIRIIRFLRLLRLVKISRIETENAEETFGVYGFNIALYAITLLLVILVLGVLLHVLGSNENTYWSVPQAMFWAFSVFLGGLPAPIPEGAVGTAIFILTKFCGMALFGLLVGVVSKLFNQWILGKKES